MFFFPQALEALGEAIKPYLQEGPAGPHLVCREIDTGGALIEMTLEGVTTEGRSVQLELMVPGSMVRMIVSSQSDGDFGFGPRIAPAILPAAGPTAPPADAPPDAVPEGGEQPAEAPPPATPAAGL